MKLLLALLIVLPNILFGQSSLAADAESIGVVANLSEPELLNYLTDKDQNLRIGTFIRVLEYKEYCFVL